MKNILCFGDSNTYGYDYRTGGRLPTDQRWSGILSEELPEGQFNVIEAGRNGRTTVFADDSPDKNGSDVIPVLLRDHYPIYCAIVMLGTNDCKMKFNADAVTIASGAQLIVNQIKLFDSRTKVILVCPVFLSGSNKRTFSTNEFDSRSVERSILLKDLLMRTAEMTGSIFLAASDIADTNHTDGVHLDSHGHRVLADALKNIILEEYNKA